MFKDKNEELRRLEALLEEEEADDMLLAAPEEDTAEEEGDELLLQEEEPDPLEQIDRYYMEQTRVFSAYNADNTEVTPEALSEEVLKEPASHISPLVAVCCGLATAVLLMILYLVLRYGGFL